MHRDHSLVEENFEYHSKSLLYDILSKNRKSKVILLSGDVHYMNRYQPACEALTGYTMPEFTSSGMTHHAKVIFGGVASWLESAIDVYQDPNYSIETVVHDYNYGRIEINTLENSVFVEMKDIHGNSHFGTSFDLSESLQFDSEALNKNRDLCVAVQRDHRRVMRIIMTLRGFSINANSQGLLSKYTIKLIFAIYFLTWLPCVALTLVIKIAAKILKWIYNKL